MGRFFGTLLGLTLAMHVFVAVAAWELFRRLHFRNPSTWAIGFALIGIALFFNRARQIMPDRKRSDAVVRWVDIPFYIHFCAAFFTLLPAFAASILWPFISIVATGEAVYPSSFIMWTYGVGLALAAYATLYRRKQFHVDHIEIKLPNLAPALEGLRIAQLSDLHVGSLTPKSWADRWVAAANREKPDIAVVTGDMVSSGVEFHDDIADSLAGLRSTLGTFASMGNHDYFGEGDPLITKLRERGITVLRNEGRELAHAGAPFYLAAADDTWTRRADVELTLSKRPEGMTTVLLAHEPSLFDEAAERNVALTLSGHTHGGQVAVPFLARRASLANLTYRYTLGLYEKNGQFLYVHPGLGTTGPPIRLGVAPAVVILTLRRA